MVGRFLLEGYVEKKICRDSTKIKIWFTQFRMHDMNPISCISTVATRVLPFQWKS